MDSLYVVVGKYCQLRCDFCMNRFNPEFDIDTPMESKPKAIIKALQDLKPTETVTLIGGEPLLFPKVILEVLDTIQKDPNNKIKNWCISTNLAYSKFTESQIKCLQAIQDASIEDISIGSSYNVNRFRNQETYFELWKKNMLYLDSIGIRVGVTVTITKEQTEQPVEELFDLLYSVKAKMVNLERVILQKPANEEEATSYTKQYEQIDEYLLKCFKYVDPAFNKQYERYKDAIINKIPVFNNYCSNYINTVYPDNKNGYKLYKIVPGCICNEVGTDLKLLVDKLESLHCFDCEYYMYCRGDCECNRFVCAFPKKTIRWLKEKIKNERN